MLDTLGIYRTKSQSDEDNGHGHISLDLTDDVEVVYLVRNAAGQYWYGSLWGQGLHGWRDSDDDASEYYNRERASVIAETQGGQVVARLAK